MRTSWMFVFVLVLVVLACNSGPGTGDGSAGATDSEETGVQSCEDYQSTPDIGPAVTVTVRHEGSTPVFHAPNGCGGGVAFVITDAANQTVPYLLNGECFPNTCEQFVSATDCSVGCNDCEPPSAGRIAAGAVVPAQWPGRWLTQLELIDECTPAEGCPATCVRPDQAPAGAYTLALTVWRTCTGTCECESPSEVCGLFNPVQLADPVTFEVTVDYPTQTDVELVITD